MTRTTLRKLRPAVDKRILVLLAGMIWIVVGIVLCSMALSWLTGSREDLIVGASGILFSGIIEHFGFARIVNKNIARFRRMEPRVCIFAFQAWKSYVLIVIMMGLGFLLRHSPLPRPYLASVYLGIGLALIVSSLRYFQLYVKTMRFCSKSLP